MKFETRFRPGDDVRALWLLVIAIVATGWFLVQTRYESAIAASHSQTELIYRQTVADARIVRQASELRQIQAHALSDLARVSHDSSLSSSTANLLATLHASAKRFGTKVTGVLPVGDSAPVDASGKADPLESTSLTIHIRGKFRDILGFVEDLSHHATLIRVSDTEMALDDTAGPDTEPSLDATVHATLYRLQLADDKEIRLASAP